MSKKSSVWLAIALVLVLVITAGAFAFLRLPTQASTVAEKAASDLSEGKVSSDVWHDGDLAQSLFDRVTKSFGTRIVLRSVTVEKIAKRGDEKIATLAWTWANLNDEAWEYTTELPLRKNGLFWWANLTEKAIHPGLGAGGRFELRANPGHRGAILGEDGKTLMEEGTVIRIGVHPARLEPSTLTTLTKALNSTIDSLDLDAGDIERKVDAANGDELVPVVTLREDDYTKVKKTIHDLPGVLFTEATQSLTRSKDFAQATLGSAGPASAEDIEKSDGAIIAGAIIGKSGLQKTFDTELSGEGSEEIFAKGGEKGHEKLTSLNTFERVDGEDIETALNVSTQDAADRAAAKGSKPTAIVAIRPSDGHILAVANHDPEGSGWDRALTGQYAPGSVFKVASGLALLEQGVSAKTTLACPKTTTIDGKSFKNAEDHVLGDVSFADDFAESCNTAFVNAAEKVSAADVAAAASSLGMDGTDLGIGAKMASVPDDDDSVVHAAQMIGQGKVVASPLAVATMAASVDEAATVTPRLVLGNAGDRGNSEGAGSSDGADTSAGTVDADSAKAMQKLMRRAVTDGTASALKDIPGKPVHGKTGTAEYGGETPPRTHSWFAGYQGDVAVAVLVEDGGFGAEAAVPVAKEFFEALS
ncbi:penicillin-binding transpeptidase domain-containing protein [Brevibacterium sp. ZH18]|uniref:penicillin-binding transpeptidase domain-containing protein n=1 Tax=Brevibacterium sp. ZH18 TaxID=2927784 RepID=UPI001F620E7D|nr:penicillin-binding transpeptidase domain-containing protein [Brevibacterium sp. ZH18]MCI4012090.1 cell division protein FtsI [Brevibacterium sp. ZH18]